MSDTDDTDVLLLIPPNFFLVNSSGSEDSFLESSRTVVHKPVSCTAQVLGKLVNQVHSLESRLETLELDTSEISSVESRKKVWDTESFDSRSLDRKCFTFPRRRRRKIRKVRSKDVSLTSLDICGKDFCSLKLNCKPEKLEKLNDSLSMDGDISSIVSTPSKGNDKLLLHEIDEFLTRVESYESPDSKSKEANQITAENIIKATGDYISQKLEGRNIDEIQLPSGRIVSSNILDKYIYLVKTANQSPQSTSSVCNIRTENDHTSYVHTRSENDSNNMPHTSTKPNTKSPSIRRLNFSDTKDVQSTSTPKRNIQPSYSDTFKPSSNKILDRASKVLEHYKSQSRNTPSSISDASELTLKRDEFTKRHDYVKKDEFMKQNEYIKRDEYMKQHEYAMKKDEYMRRDECMKQSEYTMKRDEFKMPQMRPFGLDREGYKLESIDTDLLSLSELWGERGDRGEKVDSIKLEEERLKREHCEAMIQQLQKKILEQQEKLAVAMKVDKAKDAAINKLREAWLRLTGSLDRAEERHRAALDRMVREVDNFKMVAGEAQKKTSHFETELYKALDLAHDYQEKCKLLTSEKKDLQEQMEKVAESKDEAIRLKDKEIEVLKENCETVMRLNKQSTDCVKNLEDALEKEKSDHESTKSKTMELTHKVETLSEERLVEQQERDILKAKVNEERSRCSVLEKQLCDSQNQLSELLNKCDTLDDETKNLRKHLELQKAELKSHYQQQLEDAVLAKLQEFQRQLDLAERDMEMAARNKESAVIDSFNKQITRIEEQHKLEVNVLEEKQKEEIKLYRLQLAQANEKISLLENKLETYRRRRGQIASQLHSVMESQWRQALLILTHGHAGLSHRVAPPSLDNTAPESVSTPLPPEAMCSKAGATSLPPEVFRSRHTDLQFDTLSDRELQQYVKLLLTKPPSFDADSPPDHKHLDEEPTSDRPDKVDRRDKAKRSLNPGKPPWKA
ncbi:putative leucine-rich repeat-containing protein DDB_G0290503 [Maniola hyperantus]|uniref:putative leucine-rich repeat-containing protein DDB_G0290503 n=1 Tax=Aphantopus hyperantus TaxID=2795564 RepID=UPI001568A607|nr:golgin subfamily A member 4-like [Maniola hyperantus]